MELDLDFEVKRLRLRPGDVVVVKVADPISGEVAERVKEHIERHLPVGTRALVLGPAFSLSVLSPELAAELEAAA